MKRKQQKQLRDCLAKMIERRIEEAGGSKWLAETSGVSVSVIHRIRKGHGFPGIETVCRLLDDKGREQLMEVIR